MIAARGDEQRARIGTHRRVESEHVAVEAFGVGEFGDLQVDVADPRAGRDSGRWVGSVIAVELTQEVRQVQPQRVHADRACSVVWPLRPGPVTVDLDPVAVGIVQVQRLADQVVRGATQPPARVGDPGERARQLGPVRNQYREVKQPGTARIERGGVTVLVQDDDRAAATGGGQRQRAVVRHGRRGHQTENLLVERSRTLEIRDGQRDRAERGRRVDRGASGVCGSDVARHYTEQVPSRGTPGSRLSSSANVLSSSSVKRSTNRWRTPATCERDARRSVS